MNEQTPWQQAVEAAARRGYAGDWEGHSPELRAWKVRYTELDIRAFLAECEARGWRMVPVEATNEMLASAFLSNTSWRAYLAAAPRMEGGG